MSTILLPIKPEYAYKILSGEKKYEYRKRIASLDVTRIVIYATYPISKILGEVSVSGYLKDDPPKIWDITKASSGITIEKYNISKTKTIRRIWDQLCTSIIYLFKRMPLLWTIDVV